MGFISSLKQFITDLKAQKMRTFLTIFGIVWGTVAIMVLLAFSNGFQEQTMKSMNGIGENIIILWPGQTSKPFQGFTQNRRIRLREDDAELLRSEIPGIELISPEYSNWNVPLRAGTSVRSSNVTGITEEYEDIRYTFPRPGSRFINKKDLKLRRRVVFLGDNLAEFLFGEKDPVGNTVYIGSTPFVVIGVLKEKNQDSSYNQRDTDRAFIPATTFTSMFGSRFVDNLVIKPADPRASEAIQEEIYSVLGKKYQFDPTDREALSVWDTSEFQKMVFYIFLGLKLFLVIIGSFTLTVGGIGVANIMYVVVQERTKEIGIKRSVGAKKWNIMSQFFLETLFIILFGALIGMAISLLLIFGISQLPVDDFVGTPSITWWIAIAALSILGFIGFIAGYFPARKAANLDVIKCLQ